MTFTAASISHSQSNHPSYLSFIDGLRAIAVLSVILFHLEPKWLPGGFLGVDLFFVISGYVVSRAASSHNAKSTHSFLLAFYARRMARIIPPLLACLLVTFIFTTLFIPPAWLTQAIDQTGLWAFFGTSNIVLERSAGNYFSPIAELNPFTHTWSLAIEEQFYLAFAFTFFLWNKSRRATLALCSLLALSSFVFAIMLTHPTQTGYYSSLARAWELALGVLLFQWESLKYTPFSSGSRAMTLIKRIAIPVSICSILGAFFLVKPEQMPYPGALYITLPALVLLHLCKTTSSLLQAVFLENGVSRFIGKISYSLYLWHWPVFVAWKWTVGFEGAFEKYCALAATIVLSLLSYFLVERPTRSKLKRIKPIICIVICVGATAISYLSALQLLANKNIVSQSQALQHQDLWYPNALFNHDATQPCSAQESTQNIGAQVIWIYDRGQQCTLPKRLSQTLYVLGDSHALQYRAMLVELASKTGISIRLYSNGGCPFMSLLPGGADHSKSCQESYMTAYTDIEKTIRSGDILFLSSLRTLRRVDQWGPLMSISQIRNEMNSPKTREIIEQDAARYIQLLTPLSKRGVSVIVSAPTPTWGSVPFRCADWFNHKNPLCQDSEPLSKQTFLQLRAPVMQALDELAHTLPNIKIWDTLPVLCPDALCVIQTNGKPLYFDGDHLSAYANQLLEPYFEEFIFSLTEPQSSPTQVARPN